MRLHAALLLGLWGAAPLLGATACQGPRRSSGQASRPTGATSATGTGDDRGQVSGAQAGVTARKAPRTDRRIRRLFRPEQAPALSEPSHLAPGRARRLSARLRVVGLSLPHGPARAYPLNLLSYHRVVNDRLGGRQVVVAHSPLTGASLCAEAPGPLQHSGFVLEGDDLLRSPDGTRWSVLLGRAVDGPRAGQHLRRLPCTRMRLGAWRRLQPASSVVWPERAPRGFDYTRDPWAWYRADPRHLVAPVHYVDLRAPRKQEVIGLAERGALLLPPARDTVRNLQLGGRDLLLVRHRFADLLQAFDAHHGGQRLTFRPLPHRPLMMTDQQTGSRWTLQGHAVAGPLRGARLRPRGTRALFFAWAALHPGSTIRRLQPTARPRLTRSRGRMHPRPPRLNRGPAAAQRRNNHG